MKNKSKIKPTENCVRVRIKQFLKLIVIPKNYHWAKPKIFRTKRLLPY